MATIKSYTDLEQSKKLAEILQIKSADHFYIIGCLHTDGPRYEVIRPKNEVSDYNSYLPCWSLAALLDIFPCTKESPIVNLTRGGWNPSFTRYWFATWEDEDKNIFYSCDGTSPVDAVVDLILKLYEQKLL